MSIERPKSSANGAETSTGEFKVPWDLSQWVDADTLLEWVAGDVEALDWQNPRVVALLESQPQYRPKLLLILLTWSYGTGRFESSEIYDACSSHPGLRKLCEDQPPSEKSIVRFRRDHRGLLRWALLRLVKKAVREKFRLGDIRLPAGLSRFLDDAVLLRLDVARQIERGSSGF